MFMPKTFMRVPGEPEPARTLPEIERARTVVREPGAVYRLVVVSAEEYVTKHGAKTTRCIYVADDEVMIWDWLIHPNQDRDQAEWKWNAVIDDSRNVEAGMIFYARISLDEFHGQVRNRVGRLYSSRGEAMIR